jgi:hypothetical protein
VKITPKSFGRDRRFPITNRYRRTTARTEHEGPGSTCAAGE